MKSTQAWGWLTAGVLALGVNGFLHDGGAEWARQVVCRSGAVLALASGRADEFLAKTQAVVARGEVRSCRLSTAVARWQTQMARTQAGWVRVEAMSARQEAALARLEANRARMEALAADRARIQARQASMQFISGGFNPALEAIQLRVTCPRVNMPQIRIPEVHIPEIQAPAPTEIRLSVPDPI